MPHARLLQRARSSLSTRRVKPELAAAEPAKPWRLKVVAAEAFGVAKSPARALRGQLLLRGLDRSTVRANPVVRKLARLGWAARRSIAGLPGGRRAWEAMRPHVYRPRIRVVPVDRLLMGGRNGVRSADHARRIGDLWYSSTPLADSVLVDLLHQYDEEGEGMLTDERLRGTGYYVRARQFLELDGYYFRAVNDDSLIAQTGGFIDSYRGVGTGSSGEPWPRNTMPFVRRVQHSDCYTIIDGHHRLAREVARGATQVEVVVGLGSTTTALQELLLKMSWLGGQPKLYQPVDAPELETWPLIRRCEDRLEMVRRFLGSRGWLPEQSDSELSYVDVGSSQGWFVDQMGSLGYRSFGIEVDPRAEELGRLVYGLRPGQVTVGEASDFLSAVRDPYDVVSCFSVLHHFVLGRGPCSAAELLQLLSSATSRVMFLDTGEAHESGIRRLLPEWTPDYIHRWILRNSSFREVIRLGVDSDARGVYTSNYGRTLFACVR